MNKKDTKEFKKAIEALCLEKGIEAEIIYESLETALTSAYKKNYNSLSNVRVEINRETGDIKVFSFKTVVDREEENKFTKFSDIDFTTISDDEDEEEEPVLPFVYDERIHLTLDEAKELVEDIKIGETIETEVTPKDFGRLAASTAKQVIVQKIREAEKEVIMNEYKDKEGEMVSGIVALEDKYNYYIDLGKSQGILSKSELIPGEVIQMNASIKVYITKVDSNNKGPVILLSRKHYGFVKRLFELEIPEINEGLVLVYSVAREAGVRTKVAVGTSSNNIDPVGTCIGQNGSRINRIIKDLHGEKIDIIPFTHEPAQFIKNALAPARDVYVFITNEDTQEALAVVNKDNFSLAIGKKGLNVRLASRLTHYKIDVKSFEEAKAIGINLIE